MGLLLLLVVLGLLLALGFKVVLTFEFALCRGVERFLEGVLLQFLCVGLNSRLSAFKFFLGFYKLDFR